jgi:hypothetical protein
VKEGHIIPGIFFLIDKNNRILKTAEISAILNKMGNLSIKFQPIMVK